MSTECAIPIGWDVLKCLVAPLKRGFSYVMSSKSYADNLRKEVGNLEYEGRKVGSAADEARDNLQYIHEWVPQFLASAEKALKEAEDLLENFEKVSKTCCHGTLPDPNCRYQFSRKAKHKTDDIKNLILENSNKDISYSGPAPGNVAALIPAETKGKDVVQSTTTAASASSVDFESRDLMIRNIMDALVDNRYSVVGVHGMGGVGKSTLLVDADKRIREKKLFDWVAKADVSENPDIKRIQGEIAHELGLDFKNEEFVSVRAKRLCERLEAEGKTKKVLIILDNLWKGLDLKSVGIPCGHDSKVIGCKLLLTSRNRDILRGDMGCDRDFGLDGLQEGEAKKLFERILGDRVHVDEFEPLVDEALHICAGLPFLIVNMAKRFKHTGLSEWKIALKQIKLSKNEGLGELINNMLQISYNHLNDPEKSFLALCVACGTSKPSLENLVRYGVGWGLFQEDNTMEEARDSLRTQIHNLQASSLLLEDGDAYGFKIHDLVREYVASVASKENPLLVWKDGDKSIIELSKDKLKSCRAVCFPYVGMKELPQELDCPELQIFLLFTNNESLKIPDSLFYSMRKLMVLHLTRICLTCSPSPFQFLENLQTLHLNGCSLDDVAILGELRRLHILSFVNSKIQRLPKEIGQLVQLRLLDLNYCSKLQIIEPGVLRSLIRLEELYMNYSFDRWNSMEQTPPTNASLIELNDMKNLCTLHVSIPDPTVLPGDLNIEKLTKYRIQIGKIRSWWTKYNGTKTLLLKLDSISNVLWKGCIQSILCKTDDLFLYGLDGIERSICTLSQKGFPKLKHLQVEDNPSIHYILQSPSHKDFKMLETLLLYNLINLEKLFHGHIYCKSFNALKVVRVESCDKMEVLFPHSLLRELPQLEEIEVIRCKLMQGIVEADDGGKVELHHLHVLKLYNLPHVKNFFIAGLAPSSCTSNDQVGTHIAFFNGQQVAFPRLETLQINGLDNVEVLLFPSMIKSITQLRYLDISNCKKMEAIIMEEEGLGLEISETLAFPMLTNLNLRNLESLMCFSHGKRSRETQSQDHIKSCSTAFFSREISIQSLESLTMEELPNLKKIWSDESLLGLSNLQSLKVVQCKSLSKVISFESLVKLHKLHSLSISNCHSVQEIFDLDRPSTSGDVETLSELTTFYLRGLGSLRCIWNRNPCGIVSFHNLKKLEAHDCANLKFMFFPSMVTSLEHLRDLTVQRCKKMEAIIMEEEGSGLETSKTLAFPMLTNLNLQCLESLMCFSRRKHTDSREARSHDCIKSSSNALFGRQVAFSRLETLGIYGLDNVEVLFSPSMIKSLTQLRSLNIHDCKKIKAIIMEEEGLGLEMSETLAFPMLTNLNLTNLESLMCFSHGKRSRETQSQDRIKSCSTALFNREVAFPNLENLYIEGMDNIEMIWHDPIHADSFSKLKLLSVSECKKLVNVVPSFILGWLLSLETLMAKGCDSLDVVFKLQPPNPLDGKSAAFSPLKELKLVDLSMLNCVWDMELYRHIKFQCLRSVTLQRCARLTSLFLTSIARDLIQLEELKINQCGIVELIEKEGLSELSINVEPIEGPSHELKVASSLPSYFQHMKTLDVSHCHGLPNMFTPTMATNLVGLTKLRISKCEILTEVISDEGARVGHVVAFNQLKYMELDGLTRLRCFSLGGYTLMFPLLEDVIVNRCPKMKFFYEGQMEVPKLERVQVGLNKSYGPTEYQNFWKGNLNTTIQNMLEEMAMFAGTNFMRLFEFPELIGKWQSELNPITSSWQLESLVVDKCPFINAIPSNLMLVLKRMTSLQVRDCEPLQEIFDLEGLEDVDCTQVLPRLQYLHLVNLPKLRQLWNRDLQGKTCFNCLLYLSLYKCNNLRHAFVPSMARCLPNLQEMEIKECDQMEGVIVDEEGQGSTMEEITFPKLGQITLECLPNLTSFLSWKNHKIECPILSYLTIAYCPKMRSLTWQSSMEINNGTPSLFTPQVNFPRLRRMDLSHLDKLSRIWTDGPQETLTFDCLWEVKVENCRSLENLFPHWVAISLTKLDELRVESCGIEEIVTSRDDTPHSNTTQDLFPKLTSLVLHDMPRLKSFCPNLPTLNWSLLEELRVTHCDKLNMLSFAASMNSWAQRDDQQDLLDQEAHSSFERDFPNLERLLLVNNNIQMIQDGNFPDDIFSKPVALTLACFHDKKAAFPSIFLLERFQNLQSLEVFCSSFEDLFPDEGLVEERKHPVLENLRELKLNKLHNLKCVWREDSLVSKILQSIETFEVWDCPCLTTIFPTETSFQNLTDLVVKNCSGLVHLVTALAVTNLVHLTDMTIIGCEGMKEVVADDGNREGKVISFEKLEWLTLEHLPNLECFSSIPSCIFRFPSLREIKVEECSKMKIFSKGTLSTPKLDYVTLFRYKWEGNWEKGDDLNTTIQKLAA